jgi:putative DNA primase/helicase
MKKALLGFFDKFEPNRWRTAIQSTYMSALRYKCYDIDELKSAENYINVKNGLLDISGETIKLVPHNEKIFSTVQIPIDYDKKAKCPRFKEFMRDVFQKSGNLIRLVQEIMGYCLSNSVKAHKIFIFHGAGSNGKSVLCEVMTALAGGVENVSNVPLKDLGKKFSLAQIVDKTLNIATENETDAPLDTQMLKMIASGDSIQMEAKFQAPYSYKPYIKLVFAMNNLPYVKDKSYGFERRLIIIPFNMRFVDREPRSEKEARVDRNLADTLIKNELEGIFAFAMRGLERLKKNDFGFTESRKAERKLEEYKERIDTYLEFVRQLVTENPNAEPVNVTTLWHYYKKWCDDEGYQNAKKVAQKTFGEAIRRVFEDEGILYDKRKNNKWFLHGIVVQGLNDIPQEEENDEEEIKSLDDLHDF